MPHDPLQESRDLRRQLNTLIQQARENERVLQRFQDMELCLIGAAGFRDLIEGILYRLCSAFDLSAVTLALLDPEHEIRQMLLDLDIGLAACPEVLFLDNQEELFRLLGTSPVPLLGPFNASHGFLFLPCPTPPASVAILPLARRGGLIGSMNLGSAARGRFVSGTATDFVQRLAAVAAICLENVTNNERLKHIGLTDPLTGVHNRRFFDQRLREETGRALRQGHALSCLLLDVDHFKRVNDTYGHQVGDQVLREVAGRIKLQLRLSDAMARYGGEEFAVLLSETGETLALAVAERIRRSISQQPFRLAEAKSLPVTLSIGIATFHDGRPGQDIGVITEGLVAGADRALYQAKESGRNRVVADSGR